MIPANWDGGNRQTVAIIVIDAWKISLAYTQAAFHPQFAFDNPEIVGFAHANSGFDIGCRQGKGLTPTGRD